MEELLEFKLNLTKKQLEEICIVLGEQGSGYTRRMLEEFELKLDYKEVDNAFYEVYCQLSDAIGFDCELK